MSCFDSLLNSVGLSRLLGMPFHSILTMVGKLGVKPLVQGRAQAGIRRFVDQLCAALNILVNDGDLSWSSGFQIG
ncbi:hypothetical protein D3C81_1840240 [compost metagenome]